MKEPDKQFEPHPNPVAALAEARFMQGMAARLERLQQAVASELGIPIGRRDDRRDEPSS
jgi:hypothetical protein